MKKQVRYCSLFFIFFIATQFIIAQNTAIDALQKSFRIAKNDSARLELLYSMGLSALDSADYENAVSYARQTLAFSQKLQVSPDRAMYKEGRIGEAEAWSCLGQVSFKQSDLQLSLDYYFISLAIYTGLNYKSGLAELYSYIASDYAELGDYHKSVDYYLKSLKIDEDAKMESQIAIDYSNIGAVLSDSKDDAGSIVYLYKAMALHEKLNEQDQLALCINNLGGVYQRRADSAADAGNKILADSCYNKAKNYFFKAVKINLQYADREEAATPIENIGVVYLSQGEPAAALTYLFRALDLYQSFRFKAEASYCMTSIGKAYQQLNKLPEAEKYLEQSLALAQETRSNDFLMKSNKDLSSFYETTNRPAQALHYYKEYIKYHDRVFNRESTQKQVRTEMNYDFEKQQAASRAEHEKQIIVLEGETKIQKQWRLFLFMVIGFCILVLFFVQRAYNNKKRLAVFLAAEDNRKELLLQEVHHRINNNLQIISSLLSLQANSAEDERLNVYLKQSQNRIQSLSALHELLYQNNSSLKVNMPDYIDKVLDFHRDVAGTLSAKTSIVTDVADVLFPTKIAVPIALIINELVTNSLKYAFAEKAEGTIEVLLQAADEKQLAWKLTVRDDGKGLGEITERRKGSLGLRLVTIMSKQIGATLNINDGAGASFEITFAVKK